MKVNKKKSSTMKCDRFLTLFLPNFIYQFHYLFYLVVGFYFFVCFSSYRTLPLVKEISEKLLETKKRQQAFKEAFGKTYINEFKDYVFVNPQGKLVRPDYVSEHFKILLNNKGLKHIRFHDLRHSCASLLLAKGIPMKAIQEWLGHSLSISFFNILNLCLCKSKMFLHISYSSSFSMLHFSFHLVILLKVLIA